MLTSAKQSTLCRLTLVMLIVCGQVASVMATPATAQDSVPFADCDTNGDGRVSLSEYLSRQDSPDARLRFHRMDDDENGSLTEAEWNRRDRSGTIPARRLFRGYDADGNGRLSADEWLTPVPPEARTEFEQKAKVFDFDRDGTLSYEEFTAIPGLVAERERGAVPDPIERLANRTARRILKATRVPVPADAWSAVVDSHLGAGIPATIALWDRNGDRQIDAEEIPSGIELAYGVRRASTASARTPSGRVWNANYFRSLDADGDGVWTAEEFLSRHPADQERANQEFLSGDLDSNGRLERDEVDKAGLSHFDVPVQFLLWDSDGDGLVGDDELSENARSWDRNIAVHLLPGFDSDGDGALSLLEFRDTPLGNPLADWNAVRKDANGDGRLDHDEFFRPNGLALSGLAAHFFDGFDRDQNGALDFTEFEFDVDLDRVPASHLFEALDRDRDGQLSLGEAFAPPDVSIAAGRPLLPPHRLVFLDADADGDQRLTRTEFSAEIAVRRAVVDERWYWRVAWPGFRKADVDQDGQLSLSELLASVPEDRHPVATRDFRIFDFDGQGGLDFAESVCMPGVVPASRRGPVPDPVADRLHNELSQALDLFGQENGGRHRLGREDWDEATTGRWYSSRFSEIDRDGDGGVSAQELRAGFAVMFGLRSEDGSELRRRSGLVFNWNTFFVVWDQDGDMRLSREEFVPRFWRGSEAAERQFAGADSDKDGFLAPDELAATDFVWVDVVDRFRTLDKNLDGSLDPAELDQGLAAWERPYLDQLWPSYDADADARLTFEEFRATPLGNPVLDWRGRSYDQDDDGRLSLAEFHPADGLRFLGTSKVFFDRVDRDGNGSLDLSEFDFDVDFGRVPARVVFQAVERNQDGRLTLRETVESLRGSDSALEAMSSSLQRPFQENDRNGDGVLDAGEFAAAADFHAAIRRVVWRHRNSRPKFLRRDLNGDGFVDRDEWLADRADNELPEAGYDFVLCDFDGDGRLSFNEFSCVPSVAPPARRGNVPDPIVELVDSLLKSIEGHDPNEVSATIAGQTAGAAPLDVVQGWDSDQDGRLTDWELRQGVEILFGIRDPDGTPLRRETGQVFELRTFQSYDRSADGVLAKPEFVERYWGGEEQAGEVFTAADTDGNGGLTVQEAAGGDLFWGDSLSLFRRFDTDRSGDLDASELAKAAKPWETAYLEMAFPGFDADGDGTLSFREFRETPFCNPLADWNRRRADRNHDGRLSLDEFHDGKSPARRGLSSLFLARLDRDSDGRLSVPELDFSVDLRRAPIEVVFATLDADRDAALTLSEAVGKAPAPGNPVALQNWNERSMLLEDAFRIADHDQNGRLSLEEFLRPGSAITDLVVGRNPSRTVSRRARDPETTGSAPANASPAASWNRRFVALVVFDVILLLALIWGGLRRARR
ncbi:MAG: hypothetical protein WBC44_02795 [Planctomycetaceae bacterium]